MAQVLSGSVKSGVGGFTNTVGNYNTNWLECHWTATQSGNVSTVTWRIKFCGDGTNLQRTRISKCLLTITAVTGTISSSGTLTVLPYNNARAFTWSSMNAFAPAQGDSSYSVTVSGASYLGGKFTVTHSGGVGKFKLQLEANVYEHTPELWGDAVTFELPTTTTACSAPTSVSASGIITPSGSFTVSWSGAKAGTNNTISSYQIYWRVTSGGTAPTTSTYTGTTNVTSTSTSGSTTITLSNATRGYKVVCGVVTRGSAGSSFYSGIKTGGSVTINSLPNPPTLNQSSQTILSTSTGVSVTATAGTDPDGQAVEIWYKTSSTGTLAKYTTNPSTINPSVGDSVTWYFYTKDSLNEYSQSTEITITKNLKPSLTVGTYIADTYKIQNSSGASGNYNKGYAYGITPNLTCNKVCNLRITRQYYIGNTTSSISNWSDGISTIFAVNQINVATTLGNYILYDQVPDLNSQTNFNWRLKVEVTGDLESSNVVYFPSGTEYYMIAPFMSTFSLYNQFNDSNVPDSNENQVYRKLRIKFSTDTSIASYAVSAGNITGISYITTISTNTTQIDVTLPDNISPETQIVCTVTGQPTAGTEFIRSRSITPVTETSVPDFSNEIGAYPGSIKPFSVTGATTVKITYPFADTFDTYNISSLNDIKLKIASTQNGTDAYEVVSTVSGAQWVKNNDDLTKDFNFIDFYDFNNPWNLSYDGAKTYYARVEVVNVFGQTFSTPWKEANFNFIENLRSIDIGNFQWSSSSTGTFNNLDSGNSKGRFWEGMYLKISPTISYWTKGTITVNLFDTNDTLIETKTITTQGATSQTAVNASTDFVVGPLTEFSTTDSYTYKVTAQLNGTTVTVNSSVVHPVGRLTTADYVLVSASVSNNNSSTYYINYTIDGSDSGIDTNLSKTYNITRELTIGENTNITIDPSLPTGNVDSGLDAWNVQQVGLLTTVVVNTTPDGSNTYSITKISRSPIIIVYSLSPTVAYRENQIGINTNSIDADAALIVQAASSRGLIKLKGAQHTIIIDLENGRIY